MESVSGTVSKFLNDQTSQVMGFVLDGGEEVLFPSSHSSLVTAILTKGSRVQIEWDAHSGCADDESPCVSLITNLDSKRTASLPAPVCLGKPGMPTITTPTQTASLAHLEDNGALAPMRTPTGGPTGEHLPGGNIPLPRATRNDAAAGIENAYDALHRIQAILAYLKIMKRPVPGVGQFLNEAKHTYEQALSQYDARDFEGAREFAGASLGLSLVVDIIVSRALRADTTYPSLVPPPPRHLSSPADSNRLQGNLDEVQRVLSRIRWLMANGTLPLEDRTQARRILSWSETLYRQSRLMREHGTQQDASELAQAAHSAAYSAEHICRKWYLTRNM